MEEKLLKSFVETPSFFDQKTKTNEKKVSDLVSYFFQKNLAGFKLTKIKVDKDRCNLLFLPKSPRVIFCCHLDTVLPSKKNHTKLNINNDKAYGLGTKDMKGGWVASILSVVESSKENQNKAGFLFYCDEEYLQKGMERMLKHSNKIPKTVKYFISPESRFNLNYGCRGYAVVKVIIYGKKAHTSRPHQGIHSGEILFEAYNKLKQDFSVINSVLGKSNLVITGSSIGCRNSDGLCDIHNTSVPDYAEGIFEARISKEITAKELKNIFEKRISEGNPLKYSIQVQQLRNPSNIIKKNSLKLFLNSAKNLNFRLESGIPGLAGYNDVAMISSKMKIPFLGFGPYGEGNHGPNEWVSLKSIKETKEIFKEFLKNI